MKRVGAGRNQNVKAGRLAISGLCLAAAAAAACEVFQTGGRYGPRDQNCHVTTLTGPPQGPVVDLGVISIDCWTGDDQGCQNELLDEVCRRGGDVVWGVGSLAPSTTKLTAHVARTRPATPGPAGSYETTAGAGADASAPPASSASKN